jgi:putative membrane protein
MNMILELLAAIAIGILCGIFSGITPGIHVNLVSILLLSVSPFLLQFTDPVVLCCFIIALGITHTFLDAIPSIFLGAPDEAQAMNALPGHKLLLEGKGFEAVKLTVIGALLCLLLAVVLVPPMIFISPLLYTALKDIIGYLLIAVMLFMILKDKKRIMNFFVFMLSGVLGLIVLNMPNLKDPLFPLLSGLFGTSMLIISLSEKVSIPKQSFGDTLELKRNDIAKAVGGGTFAGILTGFLPGLGPAQGAVLASQIDRKMSDFGFMILVGGLNTVNFIFSFVTLYTIDKSRNGAVVVISKLLENYTLSVLVIFLCAAVIAGAASTFLTLKLSKVFAKLVSKINYGWLAASVLVFVTSLVFYFTGWLGLLVLATSTAVGLIPGLTGVARNHQMGCLILPVILFFVL